MSPQTGRNRLQRRPIVGMVFGFCIGSGVIMLSWSRQNNLPSAPKSGYTKDQPNTGEVNTTVCPTKKALIVIVTYMRSGSSFTGDILQHNQDVFYLFEPLLVIQRSIQNNESFHNLNGQTRYYSSILNASDDIIRNWTMCKLFDLPDVVWKDQFLSSGLKTKLFKMCRLKNYNPRSTKQNLHRCLKILQNVCNSSKYIVIKTIRLPLYKLETMMNEFPNMKVIYLVRDPRATLVSQMKRRSFPKTFKNEVLKFCDRVYRDITTLDIFKNKFKGRILLLHYEHLANNPILVSRSMFQFAQMDYSPVIEYYVRSITMSNKTSNCGPYCTTKSNSTATSNAWRLELSLTQAKIIDRICLPVYRRLGFRSVENEEMLRNVSVPIFDKTFAKIDYRKL